ncbi:MULTISPECIES: monovalent cation/H+ antiporter complex subunit F [Methanobacterium]|jgi:energy-converting hydrogenase B subunit B|uniref:Monovalent cation/H+ antiporter complex subunit F n=1 Tax=Methanobacterium veterum TaxID=408577 RepID=A0A9E4ZZI9_9EURY|nr:MULTISPECIES: monovalent cation/H+ antiporter complex subunit F [Methanobacterium]MCZ3366099.1 monovalent cation/H+ antiporter complex subunit F [Methanobacterium veterum]MCZ3371673.1 monovalent cation/H+ antiporter complex subunit F [Methanobacterium veterum]
MDILTISEYILMGALAIYAIATIRISTRKTISMGIVGLLGLSIAVATLLVLIGQVYGILYCETIALALVILGPIGTIAFSKVIRGW